MKQTENKRTFAETLRTFENAYASGNYTAELWELSTAIAYAVLNKVLDPQRKTAQERQTISNCGRSPAMVAVKQGMTSDLHLLVNTRAANDAATYSRLNADGEMEWNLTADADALDAIGELIDECLTDGADMVQEVAAAILEQAKAHAAADGWMEQPYTVKRISKRVLIKEESAAWRDDVTTPVQEVYRAARRYIQNSRAAQTDPRNGYSYIEDFATADDGGMEVIYHRMQKYADMGGNDCHGNYTADVQTAIDYYTILERLHLTEKQTRIVELRMQGKGNTAIASALGVTHAAVDITLIRLREKCERIGFSPLHYAAFMDGEQD